MKGKDFTATRMFVNANKFIEAYHKILQPICKMSGLPPMAVDILMFIANNPEQNTANDICRCRGLKSGIVSVHIERLVLEGLIERREVPGDRRKTRLVCTEKATEIIVKGHKLQRTFAKKLIEGISKEELKVFHDCLATLGKNIDEIRNT